MLNWLDGRIGTLITMYCFFTMIVLAFVFAIAMHWQYDVVYEGELCTRLLEMNQTNVMITGGIDCGFR